MTTKDNSEVVWIGCLPMCWSLFVTLPLWLAILYGVISLMPNAPTWLSICFWVYVPCVMLGAVINGIASAIIKAALK